MGNTRTQARSPARLSAMAKYLRDTFFTPPALLKREPGELDQIWINGVWGKTKRFIDWTFGHNDFADEITAAEARAEYPDAF